MRKCSALITVATGRLGTQQFPVQRCQAYTTTQSLDSDADAFTIDIGDPANQLSLALERDNEVRIQLFLDNANNDLVPIFNGIADSVHLTEQSVLSMDGRDTPSVLADTDAFPGRWKHISPAIFLAQRAHSVGQAQTQIAKMSIINSLYTDGSEKEWAFWYRIARSKGMYVWSDNLGRLIINHLGYSITPTYRLGQAPRGQDSSQWFGIENFSWMSNKQSRTRKVLVYGEDAKKGTVMLGQSIDTSISAWKRKPLAILTATHAKNQAELKKQSDEEVYESIVGAQECEVTIHDDGTLIQQNKMALLNLPDYGIENELWFVVGVQRQGGETGMVQIVRLREKGFALPKRIPDAPTLPKSKFAADNKPVSSIGAALSLMPGIKWANSFVRATQEFGVAAGWDFAVFLGVLLAICSQETGGQFTNCREGNASIEWQPYDDWLNSGGRLSSGKNSAQLLAEYINLFANSAGNPSNPYTSRGSNAEAGVGPMQLTSVGYKNAADQFGWNGVPKVGEYDGGRWNPDSNIRAAAQALVSKLKAANANPTQADSIWLGVAAYNGSQAYADAVRAKFKATFFAQATGAITSVHSLAPGSTDTNVDIPGHGTLVLPTVTPAAARKAINFCLRRLGDPYEWKGFGPHYDCSSFVTAALASAAQYLRDMLNEPSEATRSHGESTYTLITKGTEVMKDNLLPADLVFFRGSPPEHVGMYLNDGMFVHDPKSGDRVKISSLNDDFYRENYSGARRFVDWPTRPD